MRRATLFGSIFTIAILIGAPARAAAQSTPEQLAREKTPHGSPTRTTLVYPSGSLRLKALLYPSTHGRSRGLVVYLHGIGNEYGPELDSVAQAYTSRGFDVFAPFRRGQGLSAGQGAALRDRLIAEQAAHGEASARRMQAALTDTEQMSDVRAAIDYARTLPGVDPDRMVVAGNSLGGALAVLAGARVPGIKAIVASAPAAQAWDKSPEMRALLIEAARTERAPVFLFQAANDYSTEPSAKLAEALANAGKVYERKLYPAFGTTTMDGHHIGYFGARIWADDVFQFLAAQGLR